MTIYKVEEQEEKIRLDAFIISKQDGLSRSHIQKLIEKGFVKVNDEIKKANYKVSLEDVITFEQMPVVDTSVIAEDIPIEIVYQDNDIVVINKKSGMIVHPGAGAYSGTLVNALLYHIKDLSGINGEVRPGIVHRIDKETTGLLVVAKNDAAHQALAKQLVDKTLTRTYLAIAHGQIFDKKILIDAPIGRDTNDRTKMAITGTGRYAITHVEVLKIYDNYTYVQCNLETGRTHQIRVHLAYIKHPIVGDPKYGYRKDDHSFGQYLHAHKLGLIHPTTNEYMEFECALPSEFTQLLEELNNVQSED